MMDRQGFVIEADPDADASGCAGPAADAPWFARRSSAAATPAIDAVHAALAAKLAAQHPPCDALAPGGVLETDPVVAVLAEAGVPAILVAVPVALGSAAADALFGGEGVADGPPTPIAIAAAQARAQALAALVAEGWAEAGRSLVRHDPAIDPTAFARRYAARTAGGDIVIAYADGFDRGAVRAAGLALAPARIDLRAVIGAPLLRVADFAALTEGSTLPLDASGEVTLLSGGREVARGELLIHEARRAVRVTAVRA